jgi:hypothetical protein
MAIGIRALWEPLRTLAYTGITAMYLPVQGALTNPCRILTITNTTDVLITISFDGVTDNAVIASMTQRIWDIGSDKNNVYDDLVISTGTTIYVRGAPTLGSVYVEAVYGA